MTDQLEQRLATAAIAAATIRKVTIGTGYFDPAYPYHGAYRKCPFCGTIYRRHGGFADHRDKCDEGPNPGANPVAPVDGGDER